MLDTVWRALHVLTHSVLISTPRVGSAISSILRVRKLGHRGEELAQDPLAQKQQKLALNMNPVSRVHAYPWAVRRWVTQGDPP